MNTIEIARDRDRMSDLKFWREGTRRLAQINPGGAVWEMKEMLRVLAKLSYTGLLANETPLHLEARRRMTETIRGRLFGKPLAYLLGEAPFLDFHVKVRPGVLIPRPETEILVTEALEWLKTKDTHVNALELGAGSGNITLGLLKGCGRLTVDAVESAPDALRVLKQNIGLHRLGKRARVRALDFMRSDSKNLLAKYDLIVSNPPYIPENEFSNLSPEVQHEPKEALIGGPHGDEMLKHIICHWAHKLKARGRMMLEMGIGQSEELKRFVSESDRLKLIQVVKDENNIARILILEKI